MNRTGQDIIETRTVKCWIEQDDIIKVVENQGSEQTLEDAKLNIEAIQRLAKGKKYPLLIDFRGIKSMNREAREYYSGEEGAKSVIAVALVISSSVSKIIANFLTKITRSKTPTRLFTTEEEAIKWLKGFLKGN